jgi:hypothetical protein
LWVIFDLLDPDPLTRLNPDPILIRIRSLLTANDELRGSRKSHLRDHPDVQAALSLSGTFLAFGLVLLLFLPVIFFILPETKGRHQLLDRVMRFSNI